MPNNKASDDKIVTKKHMARLEKEKRQRKFLLIGIIAVVAIAIIVIVYGVLSKTVLLEGKTVAKVNDEKITVSEFQDRVRYERYSLIQTFISYQMSGFGAYFQSQLLQVQNELDQYLQFGSDTLDTMISEKIIVQKAIELGITVSEEEVDKELQENFGYYANGTPTPAATVEYKPTSTFNPTQLAILATPTVQPTEMPTATTEAIAATPDENAQPTEQSLESATPTATEMIPTNTPTTEPTATVIPPTATPFTKEGYDSIYATVVSDLDAQTKFGDADFRNYVRNIIYSRKLYEYVTKDVATEQEMVWARHILVATAEDAQKVLDELNAGADFATLAATYSQDTSNSYNGGDLGWMSKGQMVTEFENAAWALEVGEVSEPVQTSFGFHIIQVLGHEVRQLSADELNTAKSTTYSAYIEEIKAAATTKKYDVWASVVPADPTIPTDYRIDTTAQ